MDRGRGRGREGERGREGGRGRGDDGFGRGRGDRGGRGERGGRGDRGRGDRGGRGDFRGGRGGGRDFAGPRGGRGGGRDFAPARYAPDRDAQEGTAARPGRRMQLKTAEEAAININQVISSFDADIQAVGVLPRPKRRGFGQRGRRVVIRANHFKVDCILGQAVHYDVSVEGISRYRKTEQPADEGRERGKVAKPLPPEVFRDVMKALAEKEKWQPGWVYDGKKNLYSPNNFLPQHETSYEVGISVEDSARTRDFKVTIKWAANINIGDLLLFVKGTLGPEVPQDAIQALDVALKHTTSMNPLCHTVARAFFFPEPSTTASLTGGAEVWLGYQQSLRPCETGLTLNVDIAATAFLKEMPTVDFLVRNAGVASVAQLSNLTPIQLRKAQKAISGLKVEATHMGTAKRKYKVKALTKEGASVLTFFNEEADKEQTVQEYFEARYKRKLEHPNLPCLNVGSPKRPIYLPAEVSKIAKGQHRLKLDERQTAEMIKTAAKRPGERAAAIDHSVNRQGKLPTDAAIKAFGMTISPQMITLEACVLDPPALQYAVPFRTPNTGDWNMRNVQFHTGARLASYGIASFSPPGRVGRSDDSSSIYAFITELLQQLMKCGLREVPDAFDLPEVVFHSNDRFPGETLKAAADLGSQHFGTEARIIFVLLPDNGAELYKEVKRASDSFIGIPSQCFVARKASIGVPMNKPRDQYCANLALKINTKLDGTNVIIKGVQPWQTKPYMVIGADVTHPMGSSESEPSIAAVVASMDANCTRFSADVKLQGHRIEILQDLKATVRKLLLNFYHATGKRKPMKIIMYRDGVSEGQFNEVQRTEIPSIIAACRELGREAGEEYAPPLTFLVVQKRHHTRFFPTDRSVDRSGNCLPGTVLDRGIVHPTEYSFFLQSHAGIQGTSRPAHYHVLLDQNQLGPDDLQAFTYNLCYTFCRCTRAVSVCPPAYYAHLAAFRGRCMMSHFEPSSDSESLASFRSNLGPKLGTHAEFAPIHAKLATRMFYV